MRAWRVGGFVAVVSFAVAPVHAQPVAGGDSLRLARALRTSIREVAKLEQASLGVMSTKQTSKTVKSARATLDAKDKATAKMTALLDTVVFQRPWGEHELDLLKRDYPGALLLDRYAADVAEKHGRLPEAIEGYARLLRMDATDVNLQVKYAQLQMAAGNRAEAVRGFSRALELSPDSATAYGALVRLHESDGTMDDLLTRIRRLRILKPDSKVVIEHEVDLLHRLGRSREADSVAKSLAEKHP
ncbi:MAG: Tetratricopeptide repeat [Gemmatimonadetes bacterium]|nr:Tetratricopeptide repeat [Gemmatimonadota bacterium]